MLIDEEIVDKQLSARSNIQSAIEGEWIIGILGNGHKNRRVELHLIRVRKMLFEIAKLTIPKLKPFVWIIEVIPLVIT